MNSRIPLFPRFYSAQTNLLDEAVHNPSFVPHFPFALARQFRDKSTQPVYWPATSQTRVLSYGKKTATVRVTRLYYFDVVVEGTFAEKIVIIQRQKYYTRMSWHRFRAVQFSWFACTTSRGRILKIIPRLRALVITACFPTRQTKERYVFGGKNSLTENIFNTRLPFPSTIHWLSKWGSILVEKMTRLFCAFTFLSFIDAFSCANTPPKFVYSSKRQIYTRMLIDASSKYIPLPTIKADVLYPVFFNRREEKNPTTALRARNEKKSE